MRSKTILRTTVAVLLFSTAPLAAGYAPTPYYSYDGASPGVRSLGMGNTPVTAYREPAAVTANPASLGFVAANTFAVTYEASRESGLPRDTVFREEALQDNNILHLTVAVPQSAFTWRPLSNLRLRRSSPGYEETDEIRINAYTLSGSQRHSVQLHSGFNVSYLSGRIAQGSITNGRPDIRLSDGQGFALDFGFLYQPSINWTVGLAFQNIAGFMWWEGFEKDLLPFTIRAGATTSLTPTAVMSAEIVRRYYRKDGKGMENTVHIGIEQTVAGALKLRAGAFGTDLDDSDTTHVTAGLGYRTATYSVGFATERYTLEDERVTRYVFGADIPF